MDRNHWTANTDVIVVADPATITLTWVPRDLWSHEIQDRINTAYRKGGHQLLLTALAALKIRADHSICALPLATCRCLANCAVTMQISEQMDFWYPMRMDLPIEKGQRLISFKPPNEILSGEKLHQWVGARKAVLPKFSNDLRRMGRQQMLVHRLLEEKYNFSSFLGDGISCSNEAAINELRLINARWTMKTLADGHFKTERMMWKYVLMPE
jgi:anionic cell wall polymer biosynthesis LytR-Cps2A-Psr (LCP) family protein